MNAEDLLALSALRKALGTLTVYKKRTYIVHRKRCDGSLQKVTIEILDGGPDVPPGIRFECVVRAEDGKLISGNPSSTAESALSLIHWEELD